MESFETIGQWLNEIEDVDFRYVTANLTLIDYMI